MEEKKNKSMLKFWLWMLAAFLVVFAMCVWASRADLDKIPHRDEGIWAIETLTTEGEVTGLGDRYVFANMRRRKHHNNFSVYLPIIDDFTGDRIPEEELANWEVGDKVLVTREVYYLKPGFRVWYEDSFEKIVDDDTPAP